MNSKKLGHCSEIEQSMLKDVFDGSSMRIEGVLREPGFTFGLPVGEDR
jgi:hypothetical protein